ncbi:serine protease [Sphaerisporangium corydalis]|uniref:serine protease n=1 Tax=Sphaerisporangium corydalis TaxID=1441875 RepID=UPI0021D0C939|nr:serine protease [Sphaerisporangium corydalis]
MSVPTAKPTKALDGLFAQAAKHAKAGRIPSDHQSQVKWVLRTARSNVDRYLAPARPLRSVKAISGGWCTGWWVTPNGYMVTGAHCVYQTRAGLRTYFATNVLPTINTTDVKGFLKSIMQVAQPDDELVKLADTVFTRFNTKKMRVTGIKKFLSVVAPLPGGGMDKTAKVTPVTLVAKGRVYPGEDFALLKMAGARNLPTVPLGRDVDVQVGDILYINGFPGLITNSPIFNLRSKLYPALTEGAYNAKRTTVLGVPYIQAQAPSYHGNSGGPVFNADGKVIGILIAGSVSETGETAENHSFILPVSIIHKRLTAAHVTARESSTTHVYNSALDDFFAARYKAALPKFRQVSRLYPAHPYVAQYIVNTQRAITAGKDRTPKSTH